MLRPAPLLLAAAVSLAIAGCKPASAPNPDSAASGAAASRCGSASGPGTPAARRHQGDLRR